MILLEDINMKSLMLLCAILLFPISLVAEEIDLEIQHILFGSTPPELVPEKDRDMIIQRLHVFENSQENKIRRQATIALLNINDAPTIQRVIRDIGSSTPSARKVAAQALTQGCRNPEVISLLETSLFVSEEPDMELIQGEFLLPRQSVIASHAICRIIAESAAIPVATRDWARDLDDLPPDELREIIRTWWKENVSNIKAKNYDRVSPVSPPGETR